MAYNILIVDDSTTTRAVIRKTLQLTRLPLGTLYEAANGTEALEVMGREWIDLVLCDINMPVMNGVEFIRKAQADEVLKSIPIAVISTEGSEERIAELQQLGIEAYLRKPFKPEEVCEMVTGLLGASHGNE